MSWSRFVVLLLALGGGTILGAAEPLAVPPAELRTLARSAERELRDNILPFWLQHARDPVTGSFHAFIGEDMVVRDDRSRGALLTCRLLWTFAAAYRQHPDPAYLEMARQAWRDLQDHFLDREHGGVIWSVGPDGRPQDARKQIYVQVFAIYGLSEFHRATGEPAALEQAKAIYRLIEEHAYDRVHGGYLDVLDRAWRRDPQTGNLLGATAKSQNSHIHILEAFTSLLRTWPDPGLRARQRELTELLLTRIINPRTHHLVLFMRDDWTPVGDAVSYGHDIELSWLLVEAAELAGDAELLARARREALAIADTTMAEGIDADGGVYLEGDPRGPTQFAKEWWEQAEAAVGFVNAYQISGDPRYFRQAQASWQFIQEHLVDRKNGDWYNTLNRECQPLLFSTTPSGAKVPQAKLSTWKCPYHNSRACLQLIERLEALAR